MEQEDGKRKGIDHKLDKYPIMTEQAPFGTQGKKKTCREGSKGKRYNDSPGNRFHGEIGGTDHLWIGTQQARQGQCQKGSDGADPTNGREDMHQEDQFARSLLERHQW